MDRSSGGSTAREPALDGLRALAVVAVLVYHQPVRWLPGGFLGVSTFFTLSGFLITRLLLHELSASGRIAVGAFYVRRFRRLAPAALLTVLGIVVAWTLAGRAVRTGDVLASIGEVQNWWLLSRGDGYASLFSDPSPFQHFWSLAIEEQFYLFFPVALLGLAAVVRRRTLGLAGGLGLGLVASVVLAARASADVAYYSTFTRAAELLAGALLAVATTSPRTAPAVSRWARSVAGGVAAPLALVALVVLWTRTHLGDAWLFPWATLANAAVTCVLVVECCSGLALRRRFAARPVAGLGRISYGVYLVHWPVYLLLPASALAWSWALFPARAGITIALAAVLFAVVEEPVRTGRAVRGAAFPLAGVALATGTIALALTIAPNPVPPLIDVSAIDAANQRLLTSTSPADADAVALPNPATAPGSTHTTAGSAQEPRSAARPAHPQAAGDARRVARPDGPPETEPATADSASPVSAPPVFTPPASALPPPAPPPALRRVLFVGDSTSWTLSFGVDERLRQQSIDVEAFSAVGCGLGGDAPIRYLGSEPVADAQCASWLAHLPDVVANFSPDVVFLVGGLADLSDRQLPDGTWSRIGMPDYDDWLTSRMRATVDVLTAGGAGLAWTTLPHIDLQPVAGQTGPPPFAENEPARADRYNALLQSVAVADPRVHVVDLASFLAARPGGEFAPGLRPDGVHLDSRHFPDVVDFLVDAAYASLATTS